MGDSYEKNLEKLSGKVNVRYGQEVVVGGEIFGEQEFQAPDQAAVRAILKMSLIEEVLKEEVQDF